MLLSIKDDELELILTDLIEGYGYDFTAYAKSSIRRRIARIMSMDKIPSFAELRYRLNNDRHYVVRFIEEITVNVTEMFRDPGFYKNLREHVLPVLATYPLIRIWHAGCATGEEVYSMAILLKEAGLLEKSLLYATDINPEVLSIARKGIYKMQHVRQYAENYEHSGGKTTFSDYYTAHYDHVKMSSELSARMIFSTHNLVSDQSFNEFQLILCRNVLIYFEKELQDRAYTLFDASLESLGYLALGAKETLRFSAIQGKYVQVADNKIWRKMQ